MTGRVDDRGVRYLLDELPDADRDAFEDEYFSDDVVYGDLLAAEDDLIDRYCQGALAAALRQRFEQRYLSTAEGRERVEFARALLRHGAAKRPASPSPASRTTLRWLAVAAAVGLAFTTLVTLAMQQAGAARRAREDRAALQEQVARQEQRASEQDRRVAELARELARAQSQARAAEELLGSIAAGTLRATSIVLKGGLRRDGTPPPRVALPPDPARSEER